MNNILTIFGSGAWIFAILFGTLLFFLGREIATWYFKINKAIRILERIERNTRKVGLKYPNEEYDEDYFRANGIKIPGENEDLEKKEY